MSILDTARTAIIGLPISDILRERLSLSIDYAADLERKVSLLQTQNGQLQAEIEAVTIDRNEHREKYDRLYKEHEEDILIVDAIAFRRGKRTGNAWSPFCPKCHMPVISVAGLQHPLCSAHCGWQAGVRPNAYHTLLETMRNKH